ncbi:MAG: sensor histidine kinase [Methanomassiliicoccus sp.]|nr:sensor histidine kinase [Methanomassiliicoccus sp.]
MPVPSGLLESYLGYAYVQSNYFTSGAIDLSGISWIYPTTLLPSIGLLVNHPDATYVPPRDPNVATYIDTMLMRDFHHVSSSASYVPIVALPENEKELDPVLRRLYGLNKDGKDYGGQNAFKYLVGELVTNVYEHSGFSHALVMAQKYQSKGFVDISFYDDGRTIPGSLSAAGMIFNNDVESIVEAVNGLSSKETEGRGYGLQTNVRICTEGLGAKILIVSRNGALSFESPEPKGYMLRDAYKLQGTSINIRLPYPAQEVDIIEYIEGERVRD